MLPTISSPRPLKAHGTEIDDNADVESQECNYKASYSSAYALFMTPNFAMDVTNIDVPLGTHQCITVQVHSRSLAISTQRHLEMVIITGNRAPKKISSKGHSLGQ